MKATLEQIHWIKNSLIILYYICDSPSSFFAIPLRTSWVLALQNPYLGSTIITKGFVFFSHPRIENKLREGIYHFWSYNIILYISHSSTFDSYQIYYRYKPVYALQPQQILPLKKQYNFERFELNKSINENCHTFCRLQFVYTKLVSMIEWYT